MKQTTVISFNAGEQDSPNFFKIIPHEGNFSELKTQGARKVQAGHSREIYASQNTILIY